MKTPNTTSGETPSARQRILNAAHDLFYREGIRATGIDRVIAESGVTKVTFYRHFPSKNDLIRAYLEYRHTYWMSWFEAALERHGGSTSGPAALLSALSEWFADGGYRGCAFINAVVELGGSQPDILAIARQHKSDMTEAIAALLTSLPADVEMARAIATMVDGAIVQAQRDGVPEPALENLAVVLQRLFR